MIKEIRSSNMEQDNRITVIINSKNSEDAEKLYEVIRRHFEKKTTAVIMILALMSCVLEKDNLGDQVQRGTQG